MLLNCLDKRGSLRDHVSLDKVKYYIENKLDLTLEQLLKNIQEEDQTNDIINLKLMGIESTIDLVGPEQALDELNELKSQQSFEDDPETSAYIKFLEAKYHITKRNWKRAEQLFRRLIRWTDKKSSILTKTNLKARSYHELSRIYFFNDNMTTALNYNNLANQSFVRSGQRPNLKYILSISKVIYLNELDRNAEALEELNRLWDSMEEIENAEIILNMYDLKADLTKKLKMYQEAIKFAKQGILFAQDSKIPTRACELWMTLGSIYVEIKKIQEAETCFLMGLKLKDRINEISREYVYFPIYKELGQLYMQQKKWDKAEKILKEGVKEKNIVTPARYNEILMVLGECYLKKKLYYEAIETFEKARVIAKENQFKEQLQTIILNIASCWKKIGNQKKFLDSLVEFYNIKIMINL